MENIINVLFSNQDLKYRDFHAKLVPNIDNDTIIGVRRPILKDIAKKLSKEDDIDLFLNDLPHKYFEENALHILILSYIKDYDLMIEKLDKFIPYINNWAVCDGYSSKAIEKNRDKAIIKIKEWLKSKHIYSKRFAICMLMNYYLDDYFNESYLKLVGNIKSNDYYLDMAIAWYFATALTKRKCETLNYLKNSDLSNAIKRMTIRKAKDSYRIDKETVLELEEILK